MAPINPDIQHNLLWQPGTLGRGFIDDNGRVHTWTYSGGRFNMYTHADFARKFDVDPHPQSMVTISPSGYIDGESRAQNRFHEADPRLMPSHDYHIGYADDEDGNHYLDWDPGFEGKGLVDFDSNVYTWKTYDGHPWHDEYMNEHNISNARSMFYVDPAGGVHSMYGSDISDADRNLLLDVDPRLTCDTPGDGWDITAAAQIPIEFSDNGDHTHGTGDHPFVYSQPDNAIWLGPINGFHSPLYRKHGLTPSFFEIREDQNLPYFHGRVHPDMSHIDWIDAPSNRQKKQEVERALSGHFGQDFASDEGWATTRGWNLSSVASSS